MDGAEACDRNATMRAIAYVRMSRRAWGFARKPLARAWVKRPLVQILVVVATIQMRTLKTEVEQGSM
jgi:hypothetical protein